MKQKIIFSLIMIFSLLIFQNVYAHQYDPAVAYNPDLNVYLVVYEDTTMVPGYSLIYGQAVKPNGDASGSAFKIDITDDLYQNYNPAVVYDNINDVFLVVWEKDDGLDLNNNYIYGQFISQSDLSGVIVSTQVKPISITTAGRYPAIASANNSVYHNLIIVWRTYVPLSGGSISQVFGRVGSYTETPSWMTITVSAPSININNAMHPAVACDESNHFFVVYEQTRYGLEPGEHYDNIYGQVVEIDGGLGDGDYFTSIYVPQDQKVPSITWDSSNNRFLVAFEQDRDVYGRLIQLGTGTFGTITIIGNSILLASGDPDQGEPSIAYNDYDNQYLLAHEYGYYGLLGGWNETVLARRFESSTLSPIGFTTSVGGTAYEYRPSVAYNSSAISYLVAFESREGGNSFVTWEVLNFGSVSDADGDGVHDGIDNCINDPNSNQADSDKDGKGNVCDNCPNDSNSDQTDSDGDLVGDVCDNCPEDSNAGQLDVDGDRVGDVCDNCIDDVNTNQSDIDGDLAGDVCDDTAVGEQPEDKPIVYPVSQPNYNLGDPINLDITVTLKPVDWDGTPGYDDTYYVKPNPYNVIVDLTDCQGNPVEPKRVLCGQPCSLKIDDTTGDPGGDLVIVKANTTEDYNVTFPVTDWYDLDSGCFIAFAKLINFCHDPRLDQPGTCTDCLEGVWQGFSFLNSLSFTVGSDQCPELEGDAGGTGCPVADKNTVWLHTINLGGGRSTKEPLAGVQVRVFDRNNSDFQALAGGKNPKGDSYGVIFEASEGQPSGLVGACTTGTDGVCFAGEEQTGEYLVIIKYSDLDPQGDQTISPKTVYVGKPKDPGDFDAEGIAELNFQVMKVFKKGVFQGYRGGRKVVVTGSILEMITPDSAIWEGTQSVYPFIFTSDSEWSVDVCARVPEGYDIMGVYDENGDMIPSAECIQTFVNGETKTIAFDVNEIGSPEPYLDATLDITTPKGKKKKKKVLALDIRKKSFLKKVKKLKVKVKKK